MTLSPTSRPASPAPADLTKDFLAGLSRKTRDAYAKDFRALARWSGHADGEDALRAILNAGGPGASATLARWRAEMLNGGLSPATAERRIAAVRSVVRAARIAGAVSWSVELPPMRCARVTKGRDLRGPDAETWAALLAAADGDDEATAVLRLMGDRGLRASEVSGLSRGDVETDPASGLVSAVWIMGKGRGGQKERLTVGPTLGAVLSRIVTSPARTWGAEDSLLPSVRSYPRLWHVLRRIAYRAGLPAGAVRPHGLRHRAITAGLDRTGGDVRAVQAFARHADPRTTMRYDDARRDVGGNVARLIDGG